MAMFVFPHNGLVLLLIGYILVLQNGLITNSITVDATRGNVAIPGNFLQIKKPPVTRLLISKPHVPHYLPCSASINYSPYEENVVGVESFLYVWYRNGIELNSFASRRNDFQLFNNGTLRLPTNEKATGVYRCLVNLTAQGHHATLSESCSVEYPILKRMADTQSNINATRGTPITLSCPVISVPTANVSWLYGNTSIEMILKENRFTTLTNGSLVLKNVTDSDRGKYKCIAHNNYAVKPHRRFFFSLLVLPPKVGTNFSTTSLKYKLVPPLQDDVHYIPSNTELQLRCLGISNSVTIEWWFQKTLEAQAEKIRNHSLEWSIHKATVDKDDGFYTCATKTDSQVFQVIVTEPPVITQSLKSYESAIAAFVNYSCSAEGNPPPEFTWYRDGQLVNGDSFTLNVNRNVLTIQSFDLSNEGIYQCFARNIAGEANSAALLRLSHREDMDIMPKALKNVQCFALNFNTINVTFQSGTTPLYFISVHFVQKSPYVWESRPPLQLNHTEYVIISGHMPMYKPFVILIRALLPISSIRYSSTGSVEETMKSSLLSEPAYCCTQGLPIRAYHMSSDVFVMWSNPELKTKYFVIQFAIAFTRPHPREFMKNLEGIAADISVLLIPDDIEDNLQEVIPLTESQARNVLSKAQRMHNDSEDYDPDEEVFSMVVPSNVTGLLLKGCLRTKIRVLVITNENEDLQQDFRHVQWKIIENDTEESATIPFKTTSIEARSISFMFAENFQERCVRVCYFAYEIPDLVNSRRSCQDVTLTSPKLVLRDLKPKKHYKVIMYSCNNYNTFGEVDVQTLPDPPGTVTNHKVVKQNGLKLSWNPPKNPNGKISYYSIFWTVNNATHEANVSSTENFFKFPNVTERAKINITIRVVGENGIGAPIFVDLRNIRHEILKDEKPSLLEHYWGILIGAILSTLCILTFSLVCIYQRHRFKRRSGQTQLTSQSESNIGAVSTPGIGGITETTGLGGFLGDSGGGLSGGLGETSALNEYHEMQTLIPKSHHFLSDVPAAPKQLPNGNGNCPRRCNDDSLECKLTETELDEEPPIALCSSTPLPTRPSPRNDDALYFIPVGAAAKSHRRDISADYPATDSNRFVLNKISSSPNFFNGGRSNSASGGCRPSALAEDCSRQRHNNRHSQRQPAAMQNGCSHYVNTENNRNSYSSSKVQLPSPIHPSSHQLNHSIDNGVASLSEPRLFATSNGLECLDSKNHRPLQVDPPDDDAAPILDRNDEKFKIFNTSSTMANNNNTLSWLNKQPPPTSKAPCFETNSTIGFESSPSAATSAADSQPRSSSSQGGLLNHTSSPPNHHNQEASSSSSVVNPLLKTNWTHRRPNVDPNG